MKFSRKVFIAIFGSTLILSSILIWGIDHFVEMRYRESYVDRYSSISKVLGNSIIEIERNTESLMFNAAQVVANEDKVHGLLSTERLSELRKTLKVTHLFATDSSGKFVRSTNEDPSLIPNIFSFCEEYKNLFNGKEQLKITPIIPPKPEPNPYKFLTIPNYNRTRLMHVGVRVDFLQNALSKTLEEDHNILSLNMYSPDGTSLGSFSKDNYKLTQSKATFTAQTNSITSEPGVFKIVTRVDSTQPHCCQCDVAGISKGGLYYYMIESVVSDGALIAAQSSMRKLFFSLQFVALLFAIFFANLLSKRLVNRIDQVIDRIQEMGKAKDFSVRIRMSGNDEIGILSSEFDGLLDKLENVQNEVKTLNAIKDKAQKQKLLIDLASQVSHDIKSPLVALELTTSDLKDLPETTKAIIRNAVNRIRDIANNLLSENKNSDAYSLEDFGSQEPSNNEQMENVLLGTLLDSIISEKRARFQKQTNVSIEFVQYKKSYGIFCRIQPNQFKRVISNLIDNAVEALVDNKGKVSVSLQFNPRDPNQVIVAIEDSGRGVPLDTETKIGQKGESFGKDSGNGLGLHNAFEVIEKFGGNIVIESATNVGSKILISLPKGEFANWFVPEVLLYEGQEIVTFDDESSIHEVWKERVRLLDPSGTKFKLYHFLTSQELKNFYGKNFAEFHDKALFLIDYEITGTNENGLELIERLGIAKNSILVTSRYEEISVREGCIRLGIKMIPKPMSNIVPIKVV